jgi:hypothetical protein
MGSKGNHSGLTNRPMCGCLRLGLAMCGCLRHVCLNSLDRDSLDSCRV